MAAGQEMRFSDLVNKPRETVALVKRSRDRSVRLRRRDDEDLVLVMYSRYEQDHEVVSVAARLLAAVIRQAAPTPELLTRVLPEVFPWMRFLPDDDARTFRDELVGTLRAADDLDNLAPVAQLITEWRHTAEVHADPQLADILRRDADDLGSVPPPKAGR